MNFKVLRAAALVIAVGCGDDGGDAGTGSSGDASTSTSATTSAGSSTTTSGTATTTTSSTSTEPTGGTGGDGFDGNLTCVDDALPTTAEDPVTVTGTVIGETGPIEATVEVLDAGDDSVLDTATTGTDGNYTLSVATGGTPRAVYFHITAPGHVETFRYFGYPLAENAMSFQQIWSDAQTSDYAAQAGVTPEAGTATLRIGPRDCSLVLTGEGTTVTTMPNTDDLVYEIGAADSCAPDATATSTSDCGFAMAYNVPAGSAAVDAAISDVAFLPQTVRADADAMTWVTLQPARP